MTVKELIDLLTQFPKELEVKVDVDCEKCATNRVYVHLNIVQDMDDIIYIEIGGH